jgi:hypothetical protein
MSDKAINKLSQKIVSDTMLNSVEVLTAVTQETDPYCHVQTALIS